MSRISKPLEGTRVLDLTIFWAGPLPSAILADLGAEVIKVEAPQRLDPFRAYGTMPGAPPERAHECSPLFNAANRNKLGITLNLADERGRQLCKALVSQCDAVVVNFSPRVMTQFGLEYETLRALKPSIVLTSISGFGRSGPWRDYVSFAAIGEALSGINSLTGYSGEGVLLHGVGISDSGTGIFAAFATVAALHAARRTGQGRHVEVAQLETSLLFITDALMEYSMTGRIRSRETNDEPARSPHGCFPAKGDDAWITISVGDDTQWTHLLQAMGHPSWAQDSAFATVLGRFRQRARLNEEVGQWTRTRDKYELAAELKGMGVPAAPVLSPAEQLQDRHLASTGFFQHVDHPYVGRHPYPSFPARFDGSYPAISRVGPVAGQDNEYVFGRLLGLSKEEIAGLEADGITGTPRL